MDIEKEYSCLEKNGLIFHRMIDCDEDYQETLQQYSDDILRIVRCDSNTYVVSTDIDNNGLHIQCKAEICITYYNDKNELCYVDFDEEFSKKVSIENISSSAFASACAVTKYTNFRVVNQRKIDIHISVSLECKVYDKISCPCISSCKNSRLKIDEIELSNIYCTNQSRVEFDEEFNIPSGANPIKRLVSVSSKAIITETKIIKDKVLIKANVDVCALYSNNDEGIEKAIHSFSVSKIIDVTGVDEDDIIIANASIGSIYCKAKNTSSEELNTIETYGSIVISSTFVKKSNANVISDGYIIGHNSRCDYSGLNCITRYKIIDDLISSSTSFKFNNDFDEIYDISLIVSNINCVSSKVKISLCAKIICKVDDSVCSLTSENSIELDAYEFEDLLGSVNIDSFDYNIVSNCKIDVRLSLKCNMYLYSMDKINVLSEIDADDKMVDYPALSVYFAKKDESVWSIAKHFSSDADLIISENQLSVDILESNKVLIIPSI